ncbi:toll-like receptor 13 [Engraulis encrasicolus]|uniref:toll-like receptor 13 n=1 Tax=Engraulis encrasicolus TaxID=184585 RepID=UPI002FD61ADB
MTSTLHRSLSAPLLITLYIISYTSHVNGFTFGECNLHKPVGNHTRFLCIKKHLQKVPQNLPVTLTTIDISFNKITAIKIHNFQNLVHLEILNISHNNISCVERGAFRSLLSLTQLNLNGNHLIKITNELFSGLTNLKVILMEFNNISTIAPSAFSIFSKLECVKLSGNNLRNITNLQPIFQRETLKELHIAHNNIAHFQSTDISNSSLHLQILNLSSNPISIFRITTNIFPNLTAIDLSFCFSVPNLEWKVQSTDFFRNVWRLDLSGINIPSMDFILQTFDKSLSQLNLRNVTDLKAILKKACLIPTLTELTLCDNGITNITGVGNNFIFEINSCVCQNLRNLTELNLGSNYIGILRGAFKNGPPKLEYLNIGGNSLHSIKTDDFRGLTSLTHLVLHDNKIDSIEAGAFDSLTSLKTLDLQTNKITDKYLTPAIFSGLPNLSKLLLHDNHLFRTKRYKTPPFCHLKSLEVLTVFSQTHSQISTYLPVNLLWNLTKLSGFWAQNVGIQSLDVNLFTNNAQLTALALSQNHFVFLSPDTFLPLRNLTKLHLRNSNLKTLDFALQAQLQNLRYLQISFNQISSFNYTIIQALPALQLLDMRGNTFTCDCSNEGFIKWVKMNNHTQVLAANAFRCNSPPNLIGTELLKLDVHSCSVDFGFYCYISSTSVVLLTMVTSLLYHFLRWKIVYAYYLFLAFLYDKKKKEPEKTTRFQYDAFLSYNLHDEHWVTGTLLPKLEGEQGWRLCLHHRDFQPGKFIVDNIIDGIYGSRKTICVISQHYLESEWCSREVQVASFRLFDEKKDVLVLVFLEDIPEYRLSAHYRIRSLLRKRTYLRWPKAGEDPRVFWEKLRLALGTTQDS